MSSVKSVVNPSVVSFVVATIILYAFIVIVIRLLISPLSRPPFVPFVFFVSW